LTITLFTVSDCPTVLASGVLIGIVGDKSPLRS